MFATILCQILAALVGAEWGLAAKKGLPWVYGRWAIAGAISLLLLGMGRIPYPLPKALKDTRPEAMALRLILASYAALLMGGEAFMYCDTTGEFLGAELLLLPFLLAIGPLVRYGEWLAAAGSALFFATCLSMALANGLMYYSSIGFFGAEIQ
ncbi:MAG: hypothetical protein U0800_07290 [Isosphaeraceae bacterium]